MAEKLLAAGTDANPARASGLTPLKVAARTGSLPVVDALLASGAAVNARTGAANGTALMWAVAGSHAEVTRALLDGVCVAGKRLLSVHDVVVGRHGSKRNYRSAARAGVADHPHDTLLDLVERRLAAPVSDQAIMEESMACKAVRRCRRRGFPLPFLPSSRPTSPHPPAAPHRAATAPRCPG